MPAASRAWNPLRGLGRFVADRLPWPRRRLAPACFSGQVMGTYYALTIGHGPADVPPEHLHAIARSRLDQIEALMSPYRPGSELSQFNAAKADTWIPVSPETAGCVALALEVAARSGGAYDLTIAPLVNLWGFGPSAGGPAFPGESSIADAMRQVGSDRLRVRMDPPGLRKTMCELRIDLSSIAKGFAVDRAAETLEAAGVTGYCLDVGGEIRVRGRSPLGRAWQIGIEMPVPDRQSVQRIVPLAAGAIATSGDYRIYIERDGTRYSHLIDPRTGWPVRHDLVSVSVLDQSCARADAWATALLVLGPDAGRAVARREQLNALFLVRHGDRVVEEAVGPAWEQ